MDEINAARRKAGQNGRLAALAEERGVSLETLLIEAVEAAGSLEAAARALDVNRNTLRYYFKKFGFELTVSTNIRRVGA